MRISVAMATYNGARFLADQLESLAQQSRLPDELIVCDDGSTDATLSIVQSHASTVTYPVIVHRNSRNIGYNANFQQAIQLCAGDLVLICDQDDVWFADKIARVEDVFASRSNTFWVTINDQEVVDTSLQRTGQTIFGLNRAIGNGEAEFSAGSCSALGRAFVDLAFPNPVDEIAYDSWIHMVAHALQVRTVIDVPLQLYRRHDDNTSSPLVLRTSTLARLLHLWRKYGLRPLGRLHAAQLSGLEAIRVIGERARERGLIANEPTERALVALDRRISLLRRRFEIAKAPRHARVRPLLKLRRCHPGEYRLASIVKDLVRPTATSSGPLWRMAVRPNAKIVAILLPDLRAGGAERVCVNLANALAHRGYSVHLLLMQRRGELLAELDGSIRVVDLGATRVRNSLRTLTAYLSESKPDALLANIWPLPVIALVARMLARCRTRIISVTHTTWSRSELFEKVLTRLSIKLSMRLFYPCLDARVAVSDGAADDLSRISGVDRNRITTIYNPIVGASSPEVEAVSLPSAWAEGVHDKVLAVGTLKTIKDFPTLVRAFARLREKRDARLLILGEGEERATLEPLIASLGLDASVLLAGHASDPRPYYRTADLFVLSSMCEGFGNVIVEALEQGTPVVSTDCPSGPREILEDGKYGTLVPVGDADALARAMEDALSRTHDHEALKRRAQDFSVDKAADAYLDLLIPGWRATTPT